MKKYRNISNMVSQPTTTFKKKNNTQIGKKDPINYKCTNIGESILSAFKSRPDFIGQVEAMTGEENTFQQMRERSVKCALWLKKIGVGRNDIVTVYTSNHLDTYIPYLATLYIGAILAVWRENRTINLIHYLQSSPKVIFTDADKALTIFNVAKRINISPKIVVFEKKSKKTSKEAEEFECVKSIINNDFDEIEVEEFSCTELESSRDIAVILFSSGTVGAIRNHVTISHAFFISPSNQQIPIMSPNDVGLWVESLHWNISLLLTVRAILSYVKAVKINSFLNPFDNFLESFCYIVQKYKVNWVLLKMIMANEFFELDVVRKYDVSSLKHVIFGGRNLMMNFLNDVDAYFEVELSDVSVIHVYCLPEIGVILYRQKFMETGSDDFVNKTFMNKTVHLSIDSITSPFKANIGIICCKSPALTNGYFLIKSDMTRTIKAATDEEGWFRTDDVGYYDSNDDIEIIDRARYIIRYEQYNFLPADIEKVLMSHPDVNDVAVIPITNTEDGHQHPLAIVVRKSNSKVTKEELIQFIAKQLEDCMHLRADVLFKDKLEYRDNKLLNREQLSEWAKGGLRLKNKKMRNSKQSTKRK